MFKVEVWAHGRYLFSKRFADKASAVGYGQHLRANTDVLRPVHVW